MAQLSLNLKALCAEFEISDSSDPSSPFAAIFYESYRKDILLILLHNLQGAAALRLKGQVCDRKASGLIVCSPMVLH